MEIREGEPRTKNHVQGTIIIRPELHAPEVDEYDEVALDRVE